MAVINFLLELVGSSTVQLHDSPGSRCACACSEAGFSSQNGDCVGGASYRRTAFCCAILWTKGLKAKDIHKEIFPVYSGKCLSCKAVHNWVEKHGKPFPDDEEFETELWKWLTQQSEDLYAAGLDALVKRWDKCISVGGGYVEK
jgi:hypothetical protein